jgi:hypothetical protein
MRHSLLDAGTVLFGKTRRRVLYFRGLRSTSSAIDTNAPRGRRSPGIDCPRSDRKRSTLTNVS